VSTRTPFLDGTPTTFAKAYPSVSTLRLVGEESGDIGEGRIPTRAVQYSQADIPARINCSNPRCKQGGYELQLTLDTVIGNKEASCHVSWSCNGREGRHGGPCTNSLKFTVDIIYRG
jgi:hypothetical protein